MALWRGDDVQAKKLDELSELQSNLFKQYIYCKLRPIRQLGK